MTASPFLQRGSIKKFSDRVQQLIEQKQTNLWEQLFTEQIFSHSKPTEYTGYRKPSLARIAMIIAYFSEHVKDYFKYLTWV